MVHAVVKFEGDKRLVKNLNALEKKVLPRAEANALNRTGTKGRKDAISEIARSEHRKKKAYRSIIRLVKRARAKKSQTAIVAVFRRQDVFTGKLSEPFQRNGKTYRRRIPGRAWTDDRPRTGSPNLPIYPDKDNVRDRREVITRSACKSAMTLFYPGELRAQLDKLIEKHIRRHGR